MSDGSHIVVVMLLCNANRAMFSGKVSLRNKIGEFFRHHICYTKAPNTYFDMAIKLDILCINRTLCGGQSSHDSSCQRYSPYSTEGLPG